MNSLPWATRLERKLHPKIKEGIAKSLVYFFTLKESTEFHKARYQGQSHAYDRFSDLIQVAHRGFSGVFPENTLLAFIEALKQGADLVELDVQYTADGQVVVCHDAQLDRLCGDPVFVRDLTLEQLKKADVGTWKNPQFVGQTIPTLQEVFETLPQNTLINIEIKHEATRFLNWDIEKKVLDIISDFQRESTVIISAFNPMVVNRIRKLNPTLSTAYMITQTLNPLLIWLLGRIKTQYLHVDLRYLNPTVIQALKTRGIQVLAYTLNDDAAFDQAQSMGLKGLITDYPDRLSKYLNPSEWGRISVGGHV